MIFEPTNIIPSTFTGTGTIAASDNVEIQWQVNGNSPMTAFKIDVYENTDTASLVHTTNIISSGYNLPFNGTNRFGEAVYFTYAPTSVSWASWGLSNGNGYKMKITQWWGSDTTASSTTKVVQVSEAAFIARTAPSIAIWKSNNDFSAKTAITSSTTFDSAITHFVGEYTQAQGDSVRWVRWVLYEVVDGGDTIVLDDTGVVYTSVFQYVYEVFLDGHTYKLALQIETQNGVQVEVQTIAFTVSYTVSQYTGVFTAQCDKRFEGVKLAWETILNIPANLPTSGYSRANGELTLNAGKEIYWDTVNDASMNFPTPWTAVWRGKTFDKGNFQSTITPSSPTGNYTKYEKTEAKSFRTGDTFESVPIRKSTSITVNVVANMKLAGANKYYGETTTVFTSGELISVEAIALGESSATINTENNSFTITATSDLPSTVRVRCAIDYYEATYYGEETYNFSGGTIVSIDTSSSALQATIGENNTYTIRFKGSYPTQPISGNITIGYNTNRSYYALYHGVCPSNGIILTETAFVSTSSDGGAELVFSDDKKSYDLYIYNSQEGKTVSALVVFDYKYLSQNKLFSINEGEDGETYIQRTSQQVFSLIIEGTSHDTIPINPDSDYATLIYAPEYFRADFYSGSSHISSIIHTPVGILQSAIHQVRLFGQQVCDLMAIFNGTDVLYVHEITNRNFTPVFSPAVPYTAEFIADFINGFDGGTTDYYSGVSIGYMISRVDIATGKERIIYKAPNSETQIEDFGITSKKEYGYKLYVYGGDDTLMGIKSIDETICMQFQKFTLLVAEYKNFDEENPTGGAYFVRKKFFFSNNITAPSISNNSAASVNANLTRYPTVMRSVQNYASGTLAGLIGVVEMREVNGEKHYGYYDDTVELETELRELSLLGYEYGFFLRDMKGHIWKVEISSPTSTTSTNKNREQTTSISLPWVEVDDASELSVIEE